MNRFRISMAMLMGVVAVAAIDCWVVRSLLAPPYSDSRFPFATGVMPVASLLILTGLLSAPHLLRSGEIRSFVIGFEALGWAAVFGFIAWYSVATRSVMDCVEVIARAIVPSPASYFQDLPVWAGLIVELGFCSTVFSLPQLLLAFLGGWLARRVGLTVRVTLAGARPREIQSP